MKVLYSGAFVLSLLFSKAHSTTTYDAGERPKTTQPRQIAIIGAGAAGSTAASFLQKYAEASDVSINITIFEKSGRIGGRTLTVNPYDDPSIRLELGASIFIEKNRILHDSLAEFNLSKRDPEADSETTLGIWDGDDFVFTIDQKDSFWWNAGKAILRYGFLAPRRTQKLMEATIDKFLQLYEEPHFPFSSLTASVHKLGLLSATGQTGEQLLKENNIGDLYAHDIIQASTRVNYASNLGAIHGLDTMVSMAPEGAMAVEGGNWQIFHKMVEKSGANLVLNTSIISIELQPPKQGDLDNNDRLDHGQFVIDHANGWSLNEGKYKLKSDREAYSTEFDHIVIATPYQFSNISLGHGVVQRPLEKIPYVKLHVTLFASPLRFSPLFFGKREGESIPATVLTTLSKDDIPTPGGAQGAGKAGFFSISTLRKTVNPKTQTEEYLYKIFSPEQVTPEFLSKLFGVPVPDTFIDADDDTERRSPSPITWYYPHVFHSYPKALPRLTFQDPIVGREVYYTSGMESFISTMETNALMGKNVARLIMGSIWKDMEEDNGSKTSEDVVEEVFKGKIECDRGRGETGGLLKNGEKPKTRPVQPVFEDL